MLYFSNLKNHPILAKDNLCIIGKLTDCLFNEKLTSVAYFLCINDEGEFLISPDNFAAMNDALVIEDCVDVRHLGDVDFTLFKSISEKSVYSSDGRLVGAVTDFAFDRSGKVGQICLDDGVLKSSEVAGVGEIILLRSPSKKRKKQKSVNLTSLAIEDKPVTIATEDESKINKEISRDITYAVEGVAVPIVSTAPKVTVATASTEPPRIISDYNFLLGRKLTADLYTFSGDLIAYKNTPVTVSVVDKARLNGKLLELTQNSHFGD